MSGRLIITPFNTQNLLDEKVEVIDALKTGFNLPPYQILSIIIKDEEKSSFSLEDAFWGFSPSWTEAQNFNKTNFSISMQKIKDADYKSFVRQIKKDGKKTSIYHFQKPCLIPVTGFLKWSLTGENKTKEQKSTRTNSKNFNKEKKLVFAIRKESNLMFYLAGIWTRYIFDIDFSFQNSFALVNKQISGVASQISSSMPLVLDKQSGLEWLKTKDLKNFKPPSAKMQIYQVSNLINSPKNNKKEILEAIGERFEIEF